MNILKMLTGALGWGGREAGLATGVRGTLHGAVKTDRAFGKPKDGPFGRKVRRRLERLKFE